MKRIIASSIVLFVTSVSTAVNATDLSQARKLYSAYCVQCHGVEGDGYGINVRDMEVLPRNHTDTEEMSTRTDKDLFKAIKHGGKSVDKSVLMPNWDGNLSDEQIEMLVQLLRDLCCKGEQK